MKRVDFNLKSRVTTFNANGSHNFLGTFIICRSTEVLNTQTPKSGTRGPLCVRGTALGHHYVTLVADDVDYKRRILSVD